MRLRRATGARGGTLRRGRFHGGAGDAPRLQRQPSVGRVARRLPGSRPDRSGSAARQGPGAAGVRREACAWGAGRGECVVPRSGCLGRVTTTLGGVATIYGCNSPQHGCNSPQHGQSGLAKGFCSPGTGAPPGNARPTNRPPPRGCREAEPSHPGPGPTGVPHGGDGRPAGAIAHRKPGRWKGARPPEAPRPASDDAPLPLPTPAAPAPPPPLPPRPPPRRGRGRRGGGRWGRGGWSGGGRRSGRRRCRRRRRGG